MPSLKKYYHHTMFFDFQYLEITDNTVVYDKYKQWD